MERTSIRTYYSNVDLSAQHDQPTDRHKNHPNNSYGRPFHIGHRQELAGNGFAGIESIGGGPDSLRESFRQTREGRRNSPRHQNVSSDFRVRSPSLPPIDRLVLRYEFDIFYAVEVIYHR